MTERKTQGEIVEEARSRIKGLIEKAVDIKERVMGGGKPTK